jgi:hypothetical protein
MAEINEYSFSRVFWWFVIIDNCQILNSNFEIFTYEDRMPYFRAIIENYRE